MRSMILVSVLAMALIFAGCATPNNSVYHAIDYAEKSQRAMAEDYQRALDVLLESYRKANEELLKRDVMASLYAQATSGVISVDTAGEVFDQSMADVGNYYTKVLDFRAEVEKVKRHQQYTERLLEAAKAYHAPGVGDYTDILFSLITETMKEETHE